MNALMQAVSQDRNVSGDFRRAMSSVSRTERACGTGKLITFSGRDRDAVERAAHECRDKFDLGTASCAFPMRDPTSSEWMVLVSYRPE